MGQRVVVPFTIACGNCFFCNEAAVLRPATTATRPRTRTPRELLMGHPMGAAFGYSHLTGGYAGGQAEYVRVPYSDVGPIVIPDDLEDDQVLFLSDILPTGWMAAENCRHRAGRHGRGLGLRPGRPVRDPVGASCWARTG